MIKYTIKEGLSKNKPLMTKEGITESLETINRETFSDRQIVFPVGSEGYRELIGALGELLEHNESEYERTMRDREELTPEQHIENLRQQLNEIQTNTSTGFNN